MLLSGFLVLQKHVNILPTLLPPKMPYVKPIGRRPPTRKLSALGQSLSWPNVPNLPRSFRSFWGHRAPTPK